ncbi:hypothetical protein C8Q80DRAFT_1355410 [Daedaleopsis nitida]|nr:hypothetical protein C8Q80DRAFT_1355410 [Daedaleopsis nitida]
MILLDAIDKSDDQPSQKLIAEVPASLHPVNRAQTPTPSLPDYEASQAQLRPTRLSYDEIKEKRTRRRKYLKYSFYALTAYFVLSVVIGIPIIVTKYKRKIALKSNPYSSWEDNSPPLPPNSITLGDAPLRISAAKQCNTWNVKDRPDGTMLLSELEYHIPSNGSIFLNTNITYATNTTYLNQFAGTLLVNVNQDSTVSDNVVHVSMHHSSRELGNSTNVCLMETGQGGGLYLFAPKTLGIADALVFNITLLLAQNNTSPRYIPQLLCHLPHFQHTYGQLDPQIAFGDVILGGASSGVYVESLQAESAVVKASSAEIRGRFKVTQQLSLETVSAPINVDAHLYNTGDKRAPTFMHLTTGNSILNANVTLYLAPYNDTDGGSDDKDEYRYYRGPHFLTHAETFNAPLNIAVAHDPESITPNLRLRANNNLGNTRVSLDSRYEGLFDVATMFAQADVFTWDGATLDNHYDGDGDDDDDDSDDDSDEDDVTTSSSVSASATSTSTSPSSSDSAVSKPGSKVRMFLPSPAVTTTGERATTTGGRCLEYDSIASSEIRGWVGIPPRPSAYGNRDFLNMSLVEVLSSIAGAQLVLEP